MFGRFTQEVAEEIAAEGAISAEKFIWHPVSRAVGNLKN